MHSAEPGAGGAERPVKEAGSQLAQTQADLQQARQENAALRRELMDALALLQQPRHIHTQTTPRPPEGEPARQQASELGLEQEREEIGRQRAELEAARAMLTAERQQLEEEKQRKRAAEATATIATQVELKDTGIFKKR